MVLFARRDFSKPGQRWRATLGFFDLLKQIRRAKYDLVVDMHGQVRSALFALISGARCASGLIGRSNSRAQFLPSTISRTFRTAAGAVPAKVPGSRTLTAFPFPTLDVHAIDRYLWVGSLLGFDDEPPDLAIHLSPETIRNVERLLEEHGVPSWQAAHCASAREQFGKQSTGPSKDLPASRAIFFAKDLRLLSRARNAMRRAASKSQPPRRGRSIFAVKLLQQIWRD